MLLFKRNGYTFKGGNFVKFILSPPEKESTLKGKSLFPLGANSFLLK